MLRFLQRVVVFFFVENRKIPMGSVNDSVSKRSSSVSDEPPTRRKVSSLQIGNSPSALPEKSKIRI